MPRLFSRTLTALAVSASGLVPFATPAHASPDGVLKAKPTSSPDVPLHFVTHEIPLRNARAGAEYRASVGGLALGGGGQAPWFRKTGGAPWVTVSAEGAISGSPPAGATGDATVTVEARTTPGQHATATLRIPVRPADAPLVPRLKVMSFNLWYGGAKVTGGREKQLKVLLDQNVDAVGLQEHMGTSARELATALGWYHHPGDQRVAVISRYPITEQDSVRSPLHGWPGVPEDLQADIAVKARVRLDVEGATDTRHTAYVSLWNTHHPAWPYAPYTMCYGNWWQKLTLGVQEAPRMKHMQLMLDAMKPDLDAKDATPVLLTGDFNAPSHLDYTKATADKHCGHDTFEYSSVMAAEAGLIDSFRTAHPDPVTTPGNTWSPVFKTFEDPLGWYGHKGEPEPQDRIDFVYHAGRGLEVLDSKVIVVGNPRPDPVEDNEWPSDHAAVLSTFRVT
ncbi:endonuclease/exonuclease/phosphatase family protein [Streptomyces sp. PR69]|uniref:endonuclease/exonuclease/phosphatase family protein n=1 Tax=Streptomyces sp. PR69 TaxID=2984950 RepID=UPI002264A057|nr:endonuclease/exonuclease/phosphatase family protein [Streptomyces sp. PR69]